MTYLNNKMIDMEENVSNGGQKIFFNPIVVYAKIENEKVMNDFKNKLNNKEIFPRISNIERIGFRGKRLRIQINFEPFEFHNPSEIKEKDEKIFNLIKERDELQEKVNKLSKYEYQAHHWYTEYQIIHQSRMLELRNKVGKWTLLSASSSGEDYTLFFETVAEKEEKSQLFLEQGFFAIKYSEFLEVQKLFEDKESKAKVESNSETVYYISIEGRKLEKPFPNSFIDSCMENDWFAERIEGMKIKLPEPKEPEEEMKLPVIQKKFEELEPEIQKILTLRKDGVSFRNIAKETGTPQTKIFRIVKENKSVLLQMQKSNKQGTGELEANEELQKANPFL